MKCNIKAGEVFVFGSNLAGRHGRGAALDALKHYGAILLQGEGMAGRSYAIPTKGWQVEKISLERIAKHVEDFKAFARTRPDLRFYVTPIGCGLAGYTRKEIKPMFHDMPENCYFAETWNDPD